MSCSECPVRKEWSDDYNQLSKEFQHYREAKEAVIIGLQDMVERLLEANARLAKDLANKNNQA